MTNRPPQQPLNAPRSAVDHLLGETQETLPLAVATFQGMRGACPATGSGKLSDGRPFYVRVRNGGGSIRIGLNDGNTAEQSYLGGFDMGDPLCGMLDDAELIEMSRELLSFPAQFRLIAGIKSANRQIVRDALRDGADAVHFDPKIGYPLVYVRDQITRSQRHLRQYARRLSGNDPTFGLTPFKAMRSACLHLPKTFPEFYRDTQNYSIDHQKRLGWRCPEIQAEARRYYIETERSRAEGGHKYATARIAELTEIDALLVRVGAIDYRPAVRWANKRQWHRLTPWLKRGYLWFFIRGTRVQIDHSSPSLNSPGRLGFQLFWSNDDPSWANERRGSCRRW